MSSPSAPSPLCITASSTASRLYWILSGPLSSSVFFMPDIDAPDTATLVPYIDSQTGTLNPLAHELMTEPPAPSLHADVHHLEMWEDDWKDYHFECCGFCDVHDEADERRTIVVSEEEKDYYDQDDNPVKIVRCCGEQRPGPSVSLEVRASDEKAGVTVKDYVEVVHPWLMGKIGEIVAAMGIYDPLPEGTVLMVNVDRPDTLMLEKQEDWIAQRRGEPIVT